MKQQSLQPYLNYLKEVIACRLQHHFSGSNDVLVLPDSKPVLVQTPAAALTLFIKKHKLAPPELITLLLALAPHVDAVFLDSAIQALLPADGNFPHLGGYRGKNHRGFLPTGETALFMVAGTHTDAKLSAASFFSPEHVFAQQQVLWLETVPAAEPQMSGALCMSVEYIELFVKGTHSHPKLSLDFPAQYLTTAMEWNDLVLPEAAIRQIDDLITWINHHDTLMNDWGMAKKLKPGYRAFFHGPPGTGKTLTASLLGKRTNKDVFRIDLSMVISKYIGETEKNLSRLFDKAEHKDWILFFDEADALFSKRTNVRDAHDKYANQEASYLLQRIEQFNGLVILATNFKNNIDDAFIRRFQCVVHFTLPTISERWLIWDQAFPEAVERGADIDLEAIAGRYELSGSAIMSIVQYVCLQALQAGTNLVSNEMLQEAIRREYLKEGKVW